MTKKKLVILGAGLFAEDVADIILTVGEFELKGFVEGQDRSRCGGMLLGRPVFWIDDDDLSQAGLWSVCAVGSTRRHAFIGQAAAKGIRFAKVVHPSAVLASTVALGQGTLVGPLSVIATETVLGEHVVVNRGCLIGHHVTIGNFATLSPGCNIAGRTGIGDRTYIGMGAIVLDGITIGAGSIVGAGAVVTRDVPERVQVMGVPARVVKELEA